MTNAVLKARFVVRVVKNVQEIGRIIRETRDMVDIYLDRGYAPNGTDPITDSDMLTTIPGDIDTQGMTIAQFNEIAQVLTALLAMADGQAVVVKNYEAIINKYRRDI